MSYNFFINPKDSSHAIQKAYCIAVAQAVEESSSNPGGPLSIDEFHQLLAEALEPYGVEISIAVPPWREQKNWMLTFRDEQHALEFVLKT